MTDGAPMGEGRGGRRRRWTRALGAYVTWHNVGSRSGFGGVVLEFPAPSEFNTTYEWSVWRPGKLARPTRPAPTLAEAKRAVERWLARQPAAAQPRGAQRLPSPSPSKGKDDEHPPHSPGGR